MAENKKKPLGKVAQKKFYHLFNDKSPARRMIFSAALVVAPTIGVSTIYNERPMTELDAGVTSVAPQYRAELEALAKELPTTTLTFNRSGERQQLTLKQAEKAVDFERRVDDFSSRLMLENKVTEREAKDIAKAYQAIFGASLQNSNINWIEGFAEYLNDSRAELARDPAPDTMEDMKTQLFKEHVLDRTMSSFIAFAIFFSLFDGWLKRGLTHGRRRDDENIQEEKVEKFEDAKNGLKDLLKPGNSPRL